MLNEKKIDFLMKHHDLVELLSMYNVDRGSYRAEEAFMEKLDKCIKACTYDVGSFKVQLVKRHKPNSIAEAEVNLTEGNAHFIKESRFPSGNRWKTVNTMNFDCSNPNKLKLYQIVDIWHFILTSLSHTYRLLKEPENEKMRWLLEALNSANDQQH